MKTLKEINENLRNGNFTERNIAMAILADYADAEEQGLLIKLPCKVGTTVYRIVNNPMWDYHREAAKRDNEPKKIIHETQFQLNFLFEIGTTVFLVKEDAEIALAH